MNTFATITPIGNYKQVRYYSIKIDGEEQSQFEKFVNNHTKKNNEKLQHILDWIKLIGDKYGAKEGFFRNEAYGSEASALPPKDIQKKPQYIESGCVVVNDLRLYTFRLNESVVFLYNGNIKTESTSQLCPQVKPHFMLANKATSEIDKLIKEREINWNDSFTDIEFDKNLEIPL